MTQFLSQSKSALHANDDQILRNLVGAFTPGGNSRRHSIPPSLNNTPPAPSNPASSSGQVSSSHKTPARRHPHHHHRPSPSQLLLRGTKWITNRRSNAGARSSGAGHYRGASAAKNRALASVSQSSASRSRIADQQRRNREAQLEALNKRTRKASSSSSSSSSQEITPDRPQSRSQRSRSNSSTAHRGGRKRETGSDEKTYCLCKKVSYGEMIACDNPRCEIEWFHFACVEVRVQPKGRWFCPHCRGETSKVKRPDA